MWVASISVTPPPSLTSLEAGSECATLSHWVGHSGCGMVGGTPLMGAQWMIFWLLCYRFEGVERDVVILSKESGADQPFTSFIGRGLIPLSPTLVFDSLRNPQLRFTYDNMLKVS